MTETGIDSALIDLIVREVVRRLRGETATGGVGGAGLSAAAGGVTDSRQPSGYGDSEHEPCRGWEHCAFRSARREFACSGTHPEHETVSLRGRVIVEEDIKRALGAGAGRVRVDRQAIVTPLARDTAREKKLAIELVDFG